MIRYYWFAVRDNGNGVLKILSPPCIAEKHAQARARDYENHDKNRARYKYTAVLMPVKRGE